MSSGLNHLVQVHPSPLTRWRLGWSGQLSPPLVSTAGSIWALAFGCKKASSAAGHEHTLTLAPVLPWAFMSPCWALNARCWPGQQGGPPLLYPCLVSLRQVKVVPGGSQPLPQEDSCVTWSPCLFSPPHRAVPNHPCVRASLLTGCFALQWVLRVQSHL